MQVVRYGPRACNTLVHGHDVWANEVRPAGRLVVRRSLRTRTYQRGSVRKQPFEPTDLLRKLADEYRHVEQEHHREPPYRGAIRHRLAAQMQSLASHFDRVLVEWTTDAALRAKWREFLHARG